MRRVPVSASCLVVKIRGAFTPCVRAIDHIEWKLGAAGFDSSSARSKTVRAQRPFTDDSSTADEPGSRIEMAFVDLGVIVPVEIAIGQDSHSGALLDAMYRASV